MRIGLTGGIASGKSTAAREFARLGAVLIDADVVAREVVEPGTEGLARLVAYFGERILRPDGRLNRAELGRIVYGDEAARSQLNSIVHPLVRARREQLEAAAPDGAIVMHDIPLLVETGQQDDFDAVIVVDVPIDIQIERIVKRDGLSREDALNRVAAQASREERLRAATYVIDSSGPKQQTYAQIAEIWDELNARRETSDRSN